MKYLFFFLLIPQVFAANIETMLCYSTFAPLIKEWGATGEWEKHFQGGLDKVFLASPTKKIGEWVVAREVEEGAVIGKVSQSGRIEAFYSKDKCKQTVKTYPHSSPPKDHKTDKDIADFISKKKTGVIYVWSPRMGLSKDGVKQIKKATKDLKLPLLILLDKETTDTELVALKKEMGEEVTMRVDSLEFNMRNVNQHYPAMMVFKDERIIPQVKYGHEKSDRYQSDVNRMLGKGQ